MLSLIIVKYSHGLLMNRMHVVGRDLYPFEYGMMRWLLFIAIFLMQLVVNDAIYETFNGLDPSTKVVAMIGVACACFAIWLVVLTPCIQRCIRPVVWEWLEGTAMAFTAWTIAQTLEFVHEAFIGKDIKQRIVNLTWWALIIVLGCGVYYYFRNVHCHR